MKKLFKEVKCDFELARSRARFRFMCADEQEMEPTIERLYSLMESGKFDQAVQLVNGWTPEQLELIDDDVWQVLLDFDDGTDYYFFWCKGSINQDSHLLSELNKARRIANARKCLAKPNTQIWQDWALMEKLLTEFAGDENL